MNRVVGILAALALMSPFAHAQRGMGAAPVFRGGPAFRSAPAPHFAPAPRRFVGGFPTPAGPVRRGFVPGFTFGHIGRGVRFRSVPFCDPTFISCQFILFNSFRRHHFRPFGFGAFGAPFAFGGYGGYPFFSDYPQADYSATASQPAPQPIIVYAQPPQEQQPAAQAAPTPAATATATPAPEPAKLPPTVLVFRDRHREEVSNYAISGEMVYVFTDQGRRKKVALSDLDLPATVKANDERGVEFRVPARKGS